MCGHAICREYTYVPYRMKYLPVLAGVVVVMSVLLLIGCGKREYVVVVDGTGQPIADAEVTSVGVSIMVGRVTTNAAGRARVPHTSMGIESIHVSKLGYAFVNVPYPPSTWPLRITLHTEVSP